MVEKIKLNIKDKIAIITLYNPPLNALNQNFSGFHTLKSTFKLQNQEYLLPELQMI